MTTSKDARDNRANQLNPTHPLYYRERGATPEEAEQRARNSKDARDSRSRQLNPKDPIHGGSEGDGRGGTEGDKS